MTQGTKQNWQNGEREPLPLSCQRTPPLCGLGEGAQEDGKDPELLGHLLWGTWPLGELMAKEKQERGDEQCASRQPWAGVRLCPYCQRDLKNIP